MESINLDDRKAENASGEDMDIKFYINDVEYSVKNSSWRNGYLVDFLREHCSLTGTKYMCRSGGCGACVVAMTKYDNVTKQTRTFAINSCLRPVYLCDGLRFTTVEGLGSSRKGFHPIQNRLAEWNGTQCGYCTPGMIMSMYSLLQNEKTPSTKTIEDLFDGNICRCTGYRPILGGMKTFGTPELKDIEDIGDWDICDCEEFEDKVIIQTNNMSIDTEVTSSVWWRPQNTKDLLKIVKDIGIEKVKLVVGNTGQGIFKDEMFYEYFIDMKGVRELNQYTTSGTFTVGANITLNQLIQLFTQQKDKFQPSYQYCGVLAEHLRQVANTPVRNVASWAGNLMLKRKHNEFQSDIFTLWEATGIRITLIQLNGKEAVISPLDLLDTKKTKGIIKNMILPKLTNQDSLVTFKAKQRHQNCHAYVNAAFLFRMDSNYKVLSQPSLVYGGIAPNFIHASKTEKQLLNKNLFDETTLQMTLNSLQDEVIPNNDPILSETKFRQLLSYTLLYKAFLKLGKENLDRTYVSGGENINRPLSSGTQDFPTNQSQWPLTQPIPKIEASPQTTGELRYTTDLPKPKNILYGYFVISSVAKASISKIDPSEALKMPGVVRFLDHKDIPGRNTITIYLFLTGVQNELFCSGNVVHAGQPIGLIVADTYEHAKAAALKVKVTYSNIKKPVLTIEDGIKQGRATNVPDLTQKVGDAEAILGKAKDKISGSVRCGHQYHFYMETMVASAFPTFDGVRVNTSTQWYAGAQDVIARVLNLDKNKVQVPSQYLGGGFGGKLLSFQTTAASALAATILNQPVYVQLDLETNMKMIGYRHPLLANYEASTDSEGVIEALKITFYLDTGSNPNLGPLVLPLVLETAKNVYNFKNLLFNSYSVLTDCPMNTPMRAPGTVIGHFVIENIMEHVAMSLGVDPVELRKKQMIQQFQHSKPKKHQVYGTYYEFGSLFNKLLTSAEVEKRKEVIAQFNQENYWRKRGLSVVPLKFDVQYKEQLLTFNAVVTILTGGGSVIVEHSGVEMGQGINTKAAQVAANQLKIPLKLISVKLTTNIVTANSFWTGASASSELVCQAIKQCCGILLERIAPVKSTMPDKPWDQVIDACFQKGVDLIAESTVGPANFPEAYSVYAAAASEAEVDILTGHVQINRADVLFDAGNSLSPNVDLGQVEGAFVMGLGYHLMEQLRFDPETGINLTCNTWEYFPPSSQDIPVDFRVSLLKNAPNPVGVLSSKATGEPPLLLGDSGFLAVKSAIAAARRQLGDTDWFRMDSPATPENILLSCKLNTKNFILKKKNIEKED